MVCGPPWMGRGNVKLLWHCILIPSSWLLSLHPSSSPSIPPPSPFLTRSFGILLWEVASQGSFPYMELSDAEVVGAVCQQQHSLLQPLDCPDNVWVHTHNCQSRQSVCLYCIVVKSQFMYSTNMGHNNLYMSGLSNSLISTVSPISFGHDSCLAPLPSSHYGQVPLHVAI